MLTAENITFKYFKDSKRTILDNISMSFRQGSVTLITGKSGCGKSTLAYILAGLYPENGGHLVSGQVRADGVNVHELKPGKRVTYVSMMFQNCDLQFCTDTLYHELHLCLENISVPPADMHVRIDEAVMRMGLSKLLHRSFNTLSGGEKQKCALCCILVLRSKYVILDEAFANIDDKSAKEIIALICKTDLTVIAIDHNKELWEGVYDEHISFDGSELFTPPMVTRTATLSSELIKADKVMIADIAYPCFSTARGSVTAITGESGSGKTNLFKALIRQKHYSGSIKIDNKELVKIKKRHLYNKCGIVFQNPANQFLALNVFDEVLYSVKRWSHSKCESIHHQTVSELLSYFELEPYKKYSPYMLSQGQQRRLAVLTMLAGNQDILLLDEPTYGQDYESVYKIMSLIKKKSEQGLTVLFNTHNMRAARDFADGIIKLEGRNV